MIGWESDLLLKLGLSYDWGNEGEIMVVIEILAQVAALAIPLGTMMFWFLNRIEKDVNKVHEDLKATTARMDARMDAHEKRIDQLYTMFIDLVKAKS